MAIALEELTMAFRALSDDEDVDGDDTHEVGGGYPEEKELTPGLADLEEEDNKEGDISLQDLEDEEEDDDGEAEEM